MATVAPAPMQASQLASSDTFTRSQHTSGSSPATAEIVDAPDPASLELDSTTKQASQSFGSQQQPKRHQWFVFALLSSDWLTVVSILVFLAVVIAHAAAGEGSNQCFQSGIRSGHIVARSENLAFVAFMVILVSQGTSMAWKFSSGGGVLNVIQNRAIYLLLCGLFPALVLCVMLNLPSGLCLSDDVLMSICGAGSAVTIHVLTEVLWAPARMNAKFSVLRREPNEASSGKWASQLDPRFETVRTSVLNYHTSSLISFTIPAFLGTFVDVRVKAVYSIVSMVVSAVSILAWCTTWWKACSADYAPRWAKRFAKAYKRCLHRRVGSHVQIQYRSLSVTASGRELLRREFKATTLSVVFGALAICASVSVVAAESGLCAILTSYQFDFSAEPQFRGSAWAGPKLTAALAECGDAWGLGVNAALPRVMHLIIVYGVFVQIAVQCVAAWSRVVLQEALAAQEKQQAQSQAMLRWLSHECRSPAAAALLTLDVLMEEIFPQLKAQHLACVSATSTSSVPASGARTRVSSPRIELPSAQDVGVVLHQSTASRSLGTSATAQEHSASGMRELIRETGSMLKMVSQPLHSLSGVLDNMLLFMQQQQGVDEQRDVHPLRLATNWLAAWSQASALQAMESMRPTDVELRYVAPIIATGDCTSGMGIDFPEAADVAADMMSLRQEEALQLMHSHDLRSQVTQATVQQVLSNLTSNAFKYGVTAEGTLDLQVQFALSASQPQVAHVLASGCRQGVASTPAAGTVEVGMCDGLDEVLLRTLAVAKAQLERFCANHPSEPAATACVLTVCVSDKGQGMSAQESASLFQPFTRLRRGRAARGTGLGLWLMRQLLQSQGGTLEVRSRGVGLGCTFIAAMPVLLVPRARGAEAPPPLFLKQLDSFDHESHGELQLPPSGTGSAVPLVQHALASSLSEEMDTPRMSHAASDGIDDSTGNPVAAASRAQTEPARPSVMDVIAAPAHQRVLVVDDSVPIRRMMARYLRNAGMTVLTADNGRSALELLQSQWRAGKPIRAVVTDMTMPIMNGDEMCRHIQRLCDPAQTEGELLPRPALIGITGNAMSEDVDRFTASGAVCVLTKPVSGKAIVGEVRSRLAAISTLEFVSGVHARP